MLAWKQPFIQRVRNSSLVEELGVDNNRVLSILPKPWNTIVLVGEHSSQRRRCGVSHAGASGKANVGISNDKGGEMPPRHKTKVSRATLIVPGLVGT